MSTKLACRLCIFEDGFTLENIDSLLKTEDEFVDHVESVHSIPVRRKGETWNKARKRFLLAYPEKSDPKKCNCETHQAKRGAIC